MLYFDRSTRQMLEGREGDGGARRDDEAFGIYAVIDGAVIITVGHRYRNLRLH